MRKFRREGIWDTKSNALSRAKRLRKNGYKVKIKKIYYPSQRKKKGYAVYKQGGKGSW